MGTGCVHGVGIGGKWAKDNRMGDIIGGRGYSSTGYKGVEMGDSKPESLNTI